MSSDLEVLAPRVIARCRELKVRLVLAEACTGGLITAALTDVPGASAVVERGFVPYSNESKVTQLGVPLDLLQRHGSVSVESVGAMVTGALECSLADWGVAETGIAGPGGGTQEKPVGLVFVAVRRRGRPAVVERHLFTGDRRAVRQAAAARGLALLLEELSVES